MGVYALYMYLHPRGLTNFHLLLLPGSGSTLAHGYTQQPTLYLDSNCVVVL